MKKQGKRTYSIVDPHEVISASIDAGTRYTGITNWEYGSLSGVFLLENKEDRRAYVPLGAISLILKHLKELKPQLVILEDFAYNKGAHFNTDQAEICGILKSYCYHNKINYTCIPPNTVKKFVTGDGRAEKSGVMKALKAQGHKYPTSHQYDSIGIGLTYQGIWDSCSENMYKRSILFKR